MLLIISRCAGVFLRNTLKPSVLSSTECHSFLNRNSSSFPELHGASFVLALFSTLPRFRCVSICSLTARHYPCFPLGPISSLATGRYSPTMPPPVHGASGSRAPARRCQTPSAQSRHTELTTRLPESCERLWKLALFDGTSARCGLVLPEPTPSRFPHELQALILCVRTRIGWSSLGTRGFPGTDAPGKEGWARVSLLQSGTDEGPR